MAAVPADEIARRVAAFEAHGCNQRAAAEALGIARETLQRSLRSAGLIGGPMPAPGFEVFGFSESFDGNDNLRGRHVRQRIERPESDGTVPPDLALKRVTVHEHRGEVTDTWKQYKPQDAERLEAIKEWIGGIANAIPPAPLVVMPSACDTDLLSLYPLGDPHLGMKAHGPEAGENFDLKIAERINKAAIDRLVGSAPASHSAILANMGDMFHADDNSNMTRQSGNKLDVDGRRHETLHVAAYLMVYMVNRLLEKHHNVDVLSERGNHDDESALALQLALSMKFAGNPRVNIDMSPAFYHYREFGCNLIGFTHGNGPKEGELPAIMANDQPEAWGRTWNRVFHRGHLHHDRVIDHVGCTVETHRTTAASDAWHRMKGYRSLRDMKRIDYHRTDGEEGRQRANVRALGVAA